MLRCYNIRSGRDAREDTGLPDERARFQVMSLLTGCGFTTRESEAILSFRPRRRLALMTMIFGYAFNITIVSAFTADQ